ncbi:MAG: putative outer rane porin protein precursor [Ramlibacter sp.]|nr:putative outer rane porin protein precursor [Ramlibacter sp.]
MKKSLIALAVMAAAGAASAQSSVTLFGIVDATLAWGRGNGTGSTDKFQLTNSGYNSSRLGFRGTEDLGGGMSASFWLEAGVNNDNGTGAATNTNNQVSGGAAAGQNGSQGLTFNRRSTVSLAGNWGEMRLGRDYTPAFWNLTVFDPFGTNGVGTSLTLNGVGLGFNPLTAAVGSVAIPSLFYPTQVRASNSIGYFLPRNLGGFYGQAQYYSGETASNTPRDGKGYGARLGYAAGPFNVAVGYGRTNLTVAAGAPAVLTSGNVRTWNIGGQWDFGVAKLLGQYSNDRLSLGGGEGTGKSWLLGALVPVGAGEIRASYSEYRLSSNLFGPDPRTQKFALGYVHNLSKRTALYTTYAYAKNRDGANSGLNGATTAANESSSGLDLGIRHSF